MFALGIFGRCTAFRKNRGRERKRFLLLLFQRVVCRIFESSDKYLTCEQLPRKTRSSHVPLSLSLFSPRSYSSIRGNRYRYRVSISTRQLFRSRETKTAELICPRHSIENRSGTGTEKKEEEEEEGERWDLSRPIPFSLFSSRGNDKFHGKSLTNLWFRFQKRRGGVAQTTP